MDLSTKTVGWVDNGLFASFARKIAPAFKKVFYSMPWQRAFPSSRELVVGEGFGDLERTLSLRKIKDQVDLWIVSDVFHADLQLDLAAEGRRVWGLRDAEELELYRWEARAWMKRIGLPVLPAELVIGIPALRAHLAKVRNKIIKHAVGRSRGDGETWRHEDYDLSEQRLKQMDYDAGPIGEEFPYLVEDVYEPAVEVGMDGAVVDSQFLDPAMHGNEVKGQLMVGVMRSLAQMPEPIRLVNAAVAQTLGDYGARGNLAWEIRWGPERRPHLIDPCMRLGSPSNELLQELIANWPEIFWEGAGGILVKPKVVKKYGTVAMAYTEASGSHWEPVFYGPQLDQWVKLRNPLRMGKRNYAVPQGQPQNVAGIVGIGDTLLESLANCAEHCKQVRGDKLEIGLKAFLDAMDIIRRGEKLGIRFCDEGLPDVDQVRKLI